MKTYQKGFTAIEGLLVAIIVLFIGFIGYYVYHSQQQTNKTLNSAQSENTTTPSLKKTTSSSSSSSSQKYFTIKEWGVRAAYSGSLTLEYALQDDTHSLPGTISLSSSQLDATSSECKVNLSTLPGYGGLITQYRSTDAVVGSDGSSTGQTAALYAATLDAGTYGHVGNYYYFYQHPQALCGSSQQSEDLQSQTQDAVKAIVSKLQAIPQ